MQIVKRTFKLNLLQITSRLKTPMRIISHFVNCSKPKKQISLNNHCYKQRGIKNQIVVPESKGRKFWAVATPLRGTPSALARSRSSVFVWQPSWRVATSTSCSWCGLREREKEREVYQDTHGWVKSKRIYLFTSEMTRWGIISGSLTIIVGELVVNCLPRRVNLTGNRWKLCVKKKN